MPGEGEVAETLVFVYHPETGMPLEQHRTTTQAGMMAGSESLAIVTDLAGAPTELVDGDAGRVVGRSVATVWGETSWSGAWTPLSFAGQQVDPETGLHYNRYRYYDAATASYVSPDPLGVEPNAASNVAYVHNPLTWVDPLGLKRCPDGDRGIVYQRTHPETGQQYVGRSRNPTTFKARQGKAVGS